MVRLKPACSATETCWNIEILQVASEVIILSKNGKTKVLIRLFEYYKVRFSPDEAHMLWGTY